MKLFVLRQYLDNPKNKGNWNTIMQLVVRANSAAAARNLAAKKSANEGPDCWLNPKRSSCTELKASGPPEIICSDYQEWLD